MPSLDFLRGAECPICIEPLLDSTLVPAPSQAAEVENSGSALRGEDQNISIHIGTNTVLELLGRVGSTLVTAAGLCYAPTEKSRRRTKSAKIPENQESSQEGIVVLPCGHLLHSACATRMYDFRPDARCPICRYALKKKSDILRLSPRCKERNVRPQWEMVVDTNNAGGGDADVAYNVDGEVRVTGTRQRSPTEVYMDRLSRELAGLEKRYKNICNREVNLGNSLLQLEDECMKLQDSLGGAQQRYNALTQNGTVGPERLQSLRRAALDTYNLVESLTKELADITRKRDYQDKRLSRLAEKMEHLRSECVASDRRPNALCGASKTSRPGDGCEGQKNALYQWKKPRL